MAFSPQEQAIIDWSVKNGKSPEEIKNALFRFRTTGSPRDPNAVVATEQPKTATQTASDILGAGIGQITSAATGAAEKVQEGFRIAQEKPKSPIDYVTKPLMSGIKAGAGFLEGIFSPAAPVFAPVGKAVSGVADVVSDIPAVQRFSETPTGEAVAKTAETVADLSTIAGFGAGLATLQPKVNPSLERHITSAKQVIDNLPPEELARMGGEQALIKNLKTNIVDGLKSEGQNVSGINSLNPANFATVDDFAKAARAAMPRAITDLFPSLRGASSKVTSALEKSEDVLASSRARQQSPTIAPPLKVESLIKDVRFAISEIDPQVETVLKQSTFDDVNKYFQQAKNAKLDPSKETPLTLAGNVAEDAYKVINEAKIDAIRGKKAILESVGDERVSGNTLNEVISTGIQRVSDKFGARVAPNGEVIQSKGRVSQLDPQDAKLVGDYFSRLNSLGVAPTLRQVDDFVDWAQSQLYKQSQSLSKFEVASDPVIRELQGITGDLNSRLKTQVGNGYGEVNARVAKLIEQQDELSRALGAEGDKGASLMKSLFSPSGERTRRIFQEVKDETGIDLFKEATLAKFAMESVGDVRQASLLKKLDIGFKEASQLDITKPLSIIQFIRERADLPPQELANEIIRRSSASK